MLLIFLFLLLSDLQIKIRVNNRVEVAGLVGSHSTYKHFFKLMTSITCAFAWLCAVLMVPLMLFIWALETKYNYFCSQSNQSMTFVYRSLYKKIQDNLSSKKRSTFYEYIFTNLIKCT